MIAFPLFAGIFSSMAHVLSGPDHLAAVTPLVFESKKKAWKIGLSWGFGHLGGMLSIGILFTIFKKVIPIDAISAYSEQLVGLVLISIGIWAFYKIFKVDKSHEHSHIHVENEPFIHAHQHVHHHSKEHIHTHTAKPKQHELASFSVGFIHGLAGVAHFILFLPILSFKTTLEISGYLGGFAIGTVAAMTLYAFAISTITFLAKNEFNPIFFKRIRMTGAMFAVLIGFYWIFST